MEIELSKYAQEQIDKIKEELKNKKDLSQMEKAYYIYYRLCQFFVPNYKFYCSEDTKKVDYEYTAPTKEDRLATCYQENFTIAQGMKQIGIEADVIKMPEQYHVDGYFTIDDDCYFFDAAGDLSRVKTGSLSRTFGMNFKRMETMRSRDYLEYIRAVLWKNKVYIDGSKSISVSEQQIREMNRKLGIDTLGITINDYIKKLKELVENQEYLENKFKTKNKAEQINNIVRIINIHKIESDSEYAVDYIAGSDFYKKIFDIFPKEYVNIFNGTEEIEGEKREITLFVVKDKGNITIYEFDEETQRLKEQDINKTQSRKAISNSRYKGFTELTQEERKIENFLKGMMDVEDKTER